jgi:hypothetical protein
MQRGLVLMALLAGCNGGAGQTETWAGSWRSLASVPGSYVTMTLSGGGTSIAGAGVQHVEAGPDRPFTVEGTSLPAPDPGVTFDYADGATERFSFAQPDADHLVLSSASRVLSFTRQ